MTHDVCAADDLRPGAMVQTSIGSRAIVVARSHAGRLHAFSDRCLHQGAPLVFGKLLAGVAGETAGEYRLADGQEVVKCPWHGYEYDLASGCALFDGRRRLRTFRVREHDGRVIIETSAKESPWRR
jgi:nitrite reductase/ring-hydroxylating ferredoxin subunit